MEETKKVTTEEVVEETVENDVVELDFWDRLAIRGRKVSKGAKKVGKVLLIGGGIVLLGGIGLACAKSIKNTKENDAIEDASWNRDDQVDIIDDSSINYTDFGADTAVEETSTVTVE